MKRLFLMFCIPFSYRKFIYYSYTYVWVFHMDGLYAVSLPESCLK